MTCRQYSAEAKNQSLSRTIGPPRLKATSWKLNSWLNEGSGLLSLAHEAAWYWTSTSPLNSLPPDLVTALITPPV